MPVYVYSITADDHPLKLDDLTGVGDPPGPLRIVSAAGLSAVVSDAAEELRPKRRDLTAHQGVQDRLMRDGTVLPFRFGLTAPDDEAVRAALTDNAETYRERLETLAGCAEYHMKVSQDEDALLRSILADSEPARQMTSAIREGSASPDTPLNLGQLVSQEVEARQKALAAGVMEALRPYARAEVSYSSGSDSFLGTSFLVGEEEEEEQFLTAQQSLAHQFGDEITFRLRGPLPPYSFV
ncbi:GvpL/GvpF family gas vesicle protein [Streptomyces sp. NPDC058001]|uniref:GvpL/GvpF family gas vesicle protein n=1 Tax=Streptomyces sp. NPDC058001 TaxID=3346300 RepID=UPI0036EDFA0A